MSSELCEGCGADVTNEETHYLCAVCWPLTWRRTTEDPNRLHDTDPMFRAVDQRMHELWTVAVGAPGYDKRKWQALEQGIFDLARRGT